MKIKILALALAFLFVFSTPVFAQYSTQDWATPTVRIFFGPDVPSEYLTSNNFFQYLILPWLAIWFVMWGILEELRIFRRKTGLNAIIAFLISFMAGATGGTLGLVRAMYGWAGVFGALAFGGLMFVGIALWVAVRFSDWTGVWKTSSQLKSAREYWSQEEEIDKLKAQIAALEAKKEGAPPEQQVVLDKELQKLLLEQLKKQKEVEEKNKPEQWRSHIR